MIEDKYYRFKIYESRTWKEGKNSQIKNMFEYSQNVETENDRIVLKDVEQVAHNERNLNYSEITLYRHTRSQCWNSENKMDIVMFNNCFVETTKFSAILKYSDFQLQ